MMALLVAPLSASSPSKPEIMMRSLWFITGVILTRIAASLPVSLYPPIIQQPSITNRSLATLTHSNKRTDLLASWPTPLPRPHLPTTTGDDFESTWMIIDQYFEPSDSSVKGEVTGNIALLFNLIDSYNPDDLVDNRRVLTSGLVSVRFPAAQASNRKRMTNSLAGELLGAAWILQYARGPRGWNSTTIKAVRGRYEATVMGVFSLCIGDESAPKKCTI